MGDRYVICVWRHGQIVKPDQMHHLCIAKTICLILQGFWLNKYLLEWCVVLGGVIVYQSNIVCIIIVHHQNILGLYLYLIITLVVMIYNALPSFRTHTYNTLSSRYKLL